MVFNIETVQFLDRDIVNWNAILRCQGLNVFYGVVVNLIVNVNPVDCLTTGNGVQYRLSSCDQ